MYFQIWYSPSPTHLVLISIQVGVTTILHDCLHLYLKELNPHPHPHKTSANHTKTQNALNTIALTTLNKKYQRFLPGTRNYQCKLSKENTEHLFGKAYKKNIRIRYKNSLICGRTLKYCKISYKIPHNTFVLIKFRQVYIIIRAAYLLHNSNIEVFTKYVLPNCYITP